jgi:hypothetical protein
MRDCLLNLESGEQVAPVSDVTVFRWFSLSENFLPLYLI